MLRVIELRGVADHVHRLRDGVRVDRAVRIRAGGCADAELELLPEEEDPEPVVDGMIDVGELAAQFLLLGVDPYPRAKMLNGVSAALSKARDLIGAMQKGN